MKKFIALFICFFIVTGTVSFAEKTSENVAPDAEKLLTDYYNTHHTGFGPDTISDIEEAFLADIDNDGTPELLFSRYLYFYGMTVFKVKNGEVIEAPEKIHFGTGTGISEKYSWLMEDDGRMYLYREGSYWVDDSNSISLQIIYSLSENELTPLKYLWISYYDNGSETRGQFCENSENILNPDTKKTDISLNEAYAKFESFKNHVAPYVVWSKNDTDKNSGLTRIWNIQKERYQKNNITDPKNSIVFSIENPKVKLKEITMMSVRFISDILGLDVKWSDLTEQLIITKRNDG